MALSPGEVDRNLDSPATPVAESWCYTHLRVIKFSYMWTIDNFRCVSWREIESRESYIKFSKMQLFHVKAFCNLIPSPAFAERR